MIDNSVGIIFRMSYRKKDGTIVRSKNGRPFPIRISRKRKPN